MQATVRVRTDQAGFCTYRASRGKSFSSNLPDLRNNGNTDARTGSIIIGPDHIFVLGTRKGDDALASSSSYWVGVTCGADPEASQTFNTRAIPWGNTAPDPIPFNASKFGNRDYPSIDWFNPQKGQIDPITGVEFWRVTQPGFVQGQISLAANKSGVLGRPIDASGTGKWANLTDVTSNGAAFSTGTGGAGDKVFIPLASGMNCAGSSNFPIGSWSEFGCTLDDISFDVYCGNASVPGIALTMQLSADGGQTVVGTPIVTSACPTTAPVKLGTYPQLKPNPPFLGWGYAPRKYLAGPPGSVKGHGTVNVANSVVTLQNVDLPQEFFDTDWTAGTPILMNNTYYHIASVQGANQLTLVEDTGSLTGVDYSGAAFGLVITKSSNGNAASVSVGANYSYSHIVYHDFTGILPLLNKGAVKVSKSADGSQTFSPPLKGYLGYASSGMGFVSIYLWIPYNSDGSVRAEVRYLSYGQKPLSSPRFHAKGDKFYNVQLGSPVLFDGVDGNTLYSANTYGGQIFKLTYDDSQPGCAGYVAFVPYTGFGLYNPNNGTPLNDDCFQWNNQTPVSQGRDLTTQIKNAYLTGKNINGEMVGPAHPGFDFGWMNGSSFSVLDGGYFAGQMQAYQDGICIIAGFRASDSVLTMISDSWNSGDARFSGCHSLIMSMGTTKFLTGHPLNATGLTNAVFPNEFRSDVVKVNRHGFGSQPLWDCHGCPAGPRQNTTIAWNEAYTCPDNLPAPYRSLSGTTNCIQLKVNTPPCQHTPNSTYHFPDGKTERDEYPCVTPGFGVANANYSKLQDFQLTDEFAENGNDQQEHMALVAGPAYNGANDIDLWMLRWKGFNYLAPLLKCPQCADKDANRHHDDPWWIFENPRNSSGGTALVFRADLPNTTPRKDNPRRSASHGAPGAGSVDGHYSFVAGGGPNNSYSGFSDRAPDSQIFAPFEQIGHYWPTFAGSQNGPGAGVSQSYPSMTYAPGSANPPFLTDYRHVNSAGVGSEIAPIRIGAAINVTAVRGTTKSYRLSNGLRGYYDKLDYKRLGIMAVAGHYVLQDVSGPTTNNTRDFPDWSVCRALRTNECFLGSTAGDYYITVPRLDVHTQSTCVPSQNSRVTPCVFQPDPWMGQIVQIEIGKNDPQRTRKFGYAGNIPLAQYGYSNCRATPDATMMFCNGPWPYDAVRADWWMYKISPQPAHDNIDRTTFVPIPIPVVGVAGASYVRARFGYHENGANLLHCMPYSQDCSTEIPSASPTDPYSFTNEAVTRQSCLAGTACTVAIPALSNRVLYYVVDYLDGSGNILSSKPKQAVAVP